MCVTRPEWFQIYCCVCNSSYCEKAHYSRAGQTCFSWPWCVYYTTIVIYVPQLPAETPISYCNICRYQCKKTNTSSTKKPPVWSRKYHLVSAPICVFVQNTSLYFAPCDIVNLWEKSLELVQPMGVGALAFICHQGIGNHHDDAKPVSASQIIFVTSNDSQVVWNHM